MGSFCGTQPQTIVNTTTNPNVAAQQNTIYGVVNGLTNQYAANPSALVAPWNSIQEGATQGLADNATSNLPWNYLGQGLIGQGSQMAATAPSFYNQSISELQGSNPITPTAWNPTQYESPYTQDVINATMANINRTNQIQQNGALGNAISQGNAFGGDRAGVAMGELARNQALASNQTLAQLQQADFNQASQQANAQQQYGLNVGLAQNAQQLQLANAYSGLGSNMVQSGLAQGNLGSQTANVGNLGQSGALSGLGALFNAGSALQTTQQQQTSAPLTLAQWLASNSPGTSATPTSTTYPGSSPAATIAGLGLAGVGAAGALSNLGFLGLFDRGGRVNKQGGGAVGGGTGHDLVDRYSQIVKAFQAGGLATLQPDQQPNPNVPGGTQVYNDPISGNVNRSAESPVTKGYNELRRAQVLENLQSARAPLMRQLAFNQLQGSPQPAGAFQAGGEVDAMGNDIASLANNDRLRTSMRMGQAGLNLLNRKSPLIAPHAPGSDNGINLAQLGGIAGGMGGLGYQEGGFIDPADNDPGNTDVGAPPAPRMNAGLGDVPPYSAPMQPRYNINQFMDPAAQKRNLWMSLLAAGAGMMANAGKRDAHGLPISGAAGIGAGLQEGVGYLSKQEEEQRKAAQHAMQLQAQWEQHQAVLRQQAGIATGILPGGQKTLQGLKNPAEIAHIEAQSEPAQIRIKGIEQANTLHAQRLKAIDDEQFLDRNAAAKADYYSSLRQNAELRHQEDLRRLSQPQGPTVPLTPGARAWSPTGGVQ